MPVEHHGTVSSRRPHLAEAFHWSTDETGSWPVSFAAGLGVAGPILLAAAVGQLQLGLVTALGAFMLGSARAGQSHAGEHGGAVPALIAIGMAAVATAIIAGHGGWTDTGLVFLAGSAALIGGYSRPLAVGTGRFIVFLVLTLSINEGGHKGASVIALLETGALWVILVTPWFERLFSGAASASSSASTTPPTASATAAQKLRRWRKSFLQLSGWQFALRLTFCLIPACMMRWFWPGHHLLWIALTTVLLCRRPLDSSLLPVTQRMIGSLVGIAGAALLAALGLSALPLALTMAALAVVTAWTRLRNYLAYTAGMTPLIILIMDAGHPIAAGILVDRLVATLIGGALVVGANRLTAKLLQSSASRPPSDRAAS